MICRGGYPIFSMPAVAYSANPSLTPEGGPLFAVEVRDHIMIAHSFRGAVFGPAQALHGATFVIDAAFSAETLDGYAYDRRMIAELGDLGWQIDLLNLGEGFPWPDEATRTTTRTRLLAMPAGRTIVI